MKFSYITLLIRNEVLRLESERRVDEIFIKLDPHYKKNVEENIDQFKKGIEGNDKEVYVEYVTVEGYFKVDAVIFKSQKENILELKIWAWIIKVKKLYKYMPIC